MSITWSLFHFKIKPGASTSYALTLPHMPAMTLGKGLSASLWFALGSARPSAVAATPL